MSSNLSQFLENDVAIQRMINNCLEGLKKSLSDKNLQLDAIRAKQILKHPETTKAEFQTIEDLDKLYQDDFLKKYKDNLDSTISASLRHFSGLNQFHIDRLSQGDIILYDALVSFYWNDLINNINSYLNEEGYPPEEFLNNEQYIQLQQNFKQSIGLILLESIALQYFPEKEFPDLSTEANQILNPIDLQGYSFSLKQKDGKTLYEKTVDDTAQEHFLENLWESYLKTHQLSVLGIFYSKGKILSNREKGKFKKSFKNHRDSMMNFDEMFFFHYHQIASSIKATYEELAYELIDSNDLKKNDIQVNLNQIKENIDTARQEAWNKIQETCLKTFKECLQKSIKKDGSINIKKLNKRLNHSIQKVKNESDNIFKEKLIENKCYIYSSPKRTSTNAFGGETLMKSTLDGLSYEVQSTPITAHTEGYGSSISKATIKKENHILHESFRTSHLVSDADAKKNNRQVVVERIQSLFTNVSSDKPIIYNLYTSVYNQTKWTDPRNSSLLTFDEPKNKQTKKLKILLDAQDEYNNAILNSSEINYKKLFFTLNTPTNGYGAEIKLGSGDPLIERAAKSNIIALAILLFGVEDNKVQELINARLEDNTFLSKYKEFKNSTSSNLSLDSEATTFLLERFKNDDAATHRHAKVTATYVGIIANGEKFTLCLGCKSGLERTGNIMGRIWTYFKKKYENTKDIKENAEDSENKIHRDYNEYGLYSAASCFISMCDQGGNPKTSKTSDQKMFFMGLLIAAASLAVSFFCPPVGLVGILGLALMLYKFKSILPNTNQAEDRNILTNYESSKMSLLQSHKDKNFDGIDKFAQMHVKESIKKQLMTGEYNEFKPTQKSSFSQLKQVFQSRTPHEESQKETNSLIEPSVSSALKCNKSG